MHASSTTMKIVPDNYSYRMDRTGHDRRTLDHNQARGSTFAQEGSNINLQKIGTDMTTSRTRKQQKQFYSSNLLRRRGRSSSSAEEDASSVEEEEEGSSTSEPEPASSTSTAACGSGSSGNARLHDFRRSHSNSPPLRIKPRRNSLYPGARCMFSE